MQPEPHAIPSLKPKTKLFYEEATTALDSTFLVLPRRPIRPPLRRGGCGQRFDRGLPPLLGVNAATEVPALYIFATMAGYSRHCRNAASAA